MPRQKKTNAVTATIHSELADCKFQKPSPFAKACEKYESSVRDVAHITVGILYQHDGTVRSVRTIRRLFADRSRDSRLQAARSSKTVAVTRPAFSNGRPPQEKKSLPRSRCKPTLSTTNMMVLPRGSIGKTCWLIFSGGVQKKTVPSEKCRFARTATVSMTKGGGCVYVCACELLPSKKG
jgi:hypothetical protein